MKKRIVCILLCCMLLCGLTIPALADGLTVPFTNDSLPEVGGTLTVDKYAMMDSGSITAEAYNALLEGNVIYSWYKNGTLVREGTAGADGHIYELTIADQGCVIYVKASFYEDASFDASKKCGEAVSDQITVPGPAPSITTESLPGATVGKDYYAKLECSDPDAVFSEVMGSQLSEFGLYLTQHGEIEGTPTKAGNCHVNVQTVGQSGGEDSTSFDLTVSAAAAGGEVEDTKPQPTEPDTQTQPVTEETPTDVQNQTQAPTTVPETTLQASDDPAGLSWWVVTLIGLAGVGTGVVVAIILVKKKS